MTRRSVRRRLPPSLLPVDAAGGFDRETEGERGGGQMKTGLAVTLDVRVRVGGGEGTGGGRKKKETYIREHQMTPGGVRPSGR